MPVVNYLWNPLNDNIVREFDDAGTVIAEYTTESDQFGNVVSQRRNGVDSVYHYDGQGSTLALTNASGDVTDAYAYSTFGEVTAHTGTTVNPFQYVGRKQYYRDAETGEYDVRRRGVAMLHGRWLSAESPAVEWNLYLYCRNSPATLLDPSGAMSIGESQRWHCEQFCKSLAPGRLKTEGMTLAQCISECLVSDVRKKLTKRELFLLWVGANIDLAAAAAAKQPPCPCTLTYDCNSKSWTNPDNSIWNDPSDVFSEYHPGAVKELRTRKAPPGDQCTYAKRKNGLAGNVLELITEGKGAGTLDIGAPYTAVTIVTQFPYDKQHDVGHVGSDITPWRWACELDKNAQQKGFPAYYFKGYIKVRPTNNKNNCKKFRVGEGYPIEDVPFVVKCPDPK